jgi:hypothetical protein
MDIFLVGPERISAGSRIVKVPLTDQRLFGTGNRAQVPGHFRSGVLQQAAGQAPAP